MGRPYIVSILCCDFPSGYFTHRLLIARASLISTADAEAADLLGIPLGAPVVLARRVFVDDAGVAIFVCDIITYRGDHTCFEVDLLPGSPFERTARIGGKSRSAKKRLLAKTKEQRKS